MGSVAPPVLALVALIVCALVAQSNAVHAPHISVAKQGDVRRALLHPQEALHVEAGGANKLRTLLDEAGYTNGTCAVRQEHKQVIVPDGPSAIHLDIADEVVSMIVGDFEIRVTPIECADLDANLGECAKDIHIPKRQKPNNH